MTTTQMSETQQRMAENQQRIAEHLVGGLANKQIAAVVGLSEPSVKRYVSQLMVTTGTRSRTELAVHLVISRRVIL